jgi:hypothetical protein
MNLGDISKEDILNVLGLTTKASSSGRVLGALGLFGLGLVAGAGAALLLAPTSGEELRRELARRMRRSNGSGEDLGDTELDEVIT